MDLIFFAAVAIYVFIKLRGQLGKVDEDQKRDAIRNFIKDQTKTSNSKSLNNVVSISGEPIPTQDKKVDNLQADERSQEIINNVDINIKDNLIKALAKVNLPAAIFINGASGAFEMIIEAFAGGDTKSLQSLLSDKILQQFELAIKERKARGQFLHTKIVTIDVSEITDVNIIKNDVLITIKFISKQINYIADNANNITEGSKEQVNTINDSWTFKRNCKSSNPNWLLVATDVK